MAWIQYFGWRHAAGSLLILLAAAVCCQAAPALPAAAASNAMALETIYPDEMGTALRAIRNNDKELAAYLASPGTVCTLFVPSNKAMSNWMKWFGKYAGKAVQNTTFMEGALNYHVIPGQQFTTEQIAKGGRQLTRANETMYFSEGQGGKPRVYSRRDYPVGLGMTNIKAGKCIVHSADMAMVNPTASAMVTAWMEELGTMPPAAPKSQWAPEQQPLPQSREALAAAPASAGADTPAAGAASKPKTSGVRLPGFSLAGVLALTVGVVAAAVL